MPRALFMCLFFGNKLIECTILVSVSQYLQIQRDNGFAGEGMVTPLEDFLATDRDRYFYNHQVLDRTNNFSDDQVIINLLNQDKVKMS